MAETPQLNTRRSFVEEKLTSTAFVKAAIILAILAIAIAVGAVINQPNNKLILIVAGAPLALLGLVYLTNHLDYAPVIVILVAGFLPYGLSTGTESKIMASLVITSLLAGLWFLRMAVVNRQFKLAPSMVNLPILAFITVAVVAWLWSLVFRDPNVFVSSTFPLVQIASTLVMVVLPLSALVVGNLVKTEKTLRWMVGLIIALVALDLVSRFAGKDLPIDANGITHMWAITFALSMALFMKGIGRWARAALLGLIAASIIWNFALHLVWYSGWLPGFICIAVISFIRSKKLFIGLVVLLMVVVAANYSYFMDNLAFKQTNDGNTRWAAWLINWQVTGQHLLFGTGPGGYAAYYMTYFPTSAMATHNNYIDIIAETGVVGLALYAWLWASLVRLGLRVVRKVRGRGDFLEAMAIGVFAGSLGCIVIMAFGDWLIPFAYTQTIAGFNYEVYSWLFLGALIVIDRLAKDQPQTLPAP